MTAPVCSLCDNDRPCFHANYIEPCRDPAAIEGVCVRAHGVACLSRCRAVWDRSGDEGAA